MNKTKLQEELNKKIKLGIKPSVLKKSKNKNEEKPSVSPRVPMEASQTNTQFNQQLATPPDSPVLKPQKGSPVPPISTEATNRPESLIKNTDKTLLKPPLQYLTPPDSPLLKPTKPSQPTNNLKDLQEQVKYWSQISQTYLLNLSKTSAELFNAEERIKEFEQQKPQTLNQAAEQALIEANQRIRELQAKNEKLNKTISELKTTAKSQENIKEQKETKEISTQTEPAFFHCDNCQQSKHGNYTIRKIDSPFESRTHQKLCYICSDCRKYTKEYNEKTRLQNEINETKGKVAEEVNVTLEAEISALPKLTARIEMKNINIWPFNKK